MATSNFEVNSLVEGLIKTKESSTIAKGHYLASLDGYIGSTEKNNVRLYSGLDLGEYIDIPESKIIKVKYTSKNPEDMCNLIFYANCELKYVRAVTFNPIDIIEGQSKSSSGAGACNCSGQQSAARLDNQGPELPPMNCEITCEMRRNVCEDFGMGWCSLRNYLCRLGCIYDDVFGGSRGIFGL